MPQGRLDAPAVRAWAHRAVDDLAEHADEINRLNVFPVADADTGTNMLFTMRAALAEADAVAATDDVDATDDVRRVTAALARGALDGARGNSGVILAQILRALAAVTADAGAETDIDPALFGAALRHAVALVVSAMGGVVVAGTVVSVLQAAAEAADRCAVGGAGPASVAAAAGEAAAVALDRTPDQLPVLAAAGVVDAGGRGLLVVLDALCSALGGQPPARGEYRPGPRIGDHGVTEAAPPQFEVMFQVAECDPDGLKRLRADLESLGDSVSLAPATAPWHSVHVHTDDAGAAVEAGLAAGALSRIRIASLDGGRVSPGTWKRRRAVLAVVDGKGADELFGAEGAHVVIPDADLADPVDGLSAEQLRRALVDTGASSVLVLPNGYVSAEDLVAGCTAAIGWGIDVVPVPAGSMVQGLAALAVHDPDRHAVDDGYAMAQAAAGARCGSVRLAAAKALTWAGPCGPGDGLGIVGDEVVVVAADVAAAAIRLIDLLLGPGGELVTVLLGAAAAAESALADLLAEHVHRRHPGTEFSSYRTGHRGDVLLIGVE